LGVAADAAFGTNTTKVRPAVAKVAMLNQRLRGFRIIQS